MKQTLAIFGAVIAIALCACPPAIKKPPVKKTPRVPTEVRKPSPPPAVIATPQRNASNRLIENGITALESDRLDMAEGIFQDALNIDASNGVAYYYLALTNHRLGEQGEARGLLDKASQLLQNDPYWKGLVDELLNEISGNGQPVKPTDEF